MDDDLEENPDKAGEMELPQLAAAPPPLTLPQPWSGAQATGIIRAVAAGDHTLSLTIHANEQMDERGLWTGDALYVLKNGFVHAPPQKSTRPAFYKYKMDSKTPNSNNRILRAVVLPDSVHKELKLITVMWKDEDTFKG